MKKLLSLGLAAGILLTIPAAAYAAENQWYGWDTKTTILGKLYKTNSQYYTANASTTSKAGRKGVEVAIWPVDGKGNRLMASKYSKNANSATVWVFQTCPGVKVWGSGHTTYPTKDPWNWLAIYV